MDNTGNIGESGRTASNTGAPQVVDANPAPPPPSNVVMLYHGVPAPKLAPASGAYRSRELMQIATLMGISEEQLMQGRQILDLVGDPLRRTILEVLAAKPQAPSERLRHLTGANAGDISHRLRSLRRAGLVTTGPHNTYRVDPAALVAARGYFDLLLCASSSPRGKNTVAG